MEPFLSICCCMVLFRCFFLAGIFRPVTGLGCGLLPDRISAILYCDIRKDKYVSSGTGGNHMYDDFNCIHNYLQRYVGPGGDVVIPPKVAIIGRGAFHNCKYITSVTIPSTVMIVEDGAFAGCTKLEEFRVDPHHENYASEGAILFEPETKTLLSAPNVSGEYTIPPFFRRIAGHAFQGNKKLTDVVIPKTVRELGDCAFQDCTSLLSVSLPSNLRVISRGLFRGCSVLEECPIPENILAIGHEAFQGCAALKEITIPSHCLNLYAKAFADCTSLQTMSFPDGVQVLPESILSGCHSLCEVTLPDSLHTLGSNAFADCISLEQVLIPESVNRIPAGCFRNCADLKMFSFPESIQTIGSSAFHGCSGLREARVPVSVKKIEEHSFADCPRLTLIVPGARTVISPSTLALSKEFRIQELPTLVVLSQPMDSLDRNLKSNALLGYLWMKKHQVHIKENVRKTYLTYMNQNKARLWTRPAILQCILDEKLIPREGISVFLEKAQKMERPDLAAMLLQSVHDNYTVEDLDRARIDEYQEAMGLPSLAEIQKTWHYIREDDDSIRITSYHGNSVKVEVLDSVGLDFVTAIGPYAFSPDAAGADEMLQFRRRSIREIVVPEGVLQIGGGAFQNCDGLETLVLPETVEEIAEDAMDGCENLTIEAPTGSFAATFALNHEIPYTPSDL